MAFGAQVFGLRLQQQCGVGRFFERGGRGFAVEADDVGVRSFLIS